MSPETIRSVAFLTGLMAFLIWEWLAPHHVRSIPRLRRWFVNLSLSAINAAASAGLCAVCLYVTTAGLIPWRLGVFDGLSSWPVGRWLAEIVLLDFVIYWQHRGFHTIPFLWRFHRVHHTDADLDVTSASRFHLGEIVLSSFLKLLVAVTLGISVVGLAAFEITLLVAAQFQHSNIALPTGVTRLLWYFVVPPEMHRVHHCPARRHHDSNYGTILTLWDWLLGTLVWPKRHAPTFGLADSRERRGGLWALLCLPFRK